jgi:hypothetical protein
VGVWVRAFDCALHCGLVSGSLVTNEAAVAAYKLGVPY